MGEGQRTSPCFYKLPSIIVSGGHIASSPCGIATSPCVHTAGTYTLTHIHLLSSMLRHGT